MMYRLYRFDSEPPETPPVGMTELLAMGHYLNADNAMRFFRRHLPAEIKMFYNGQPATHIGLYDWTDKLILTEKV